MKVIFKKDFNYKWPSRAVTFCQAGPDPITVRRELGEAAIEKGYATEAPTDVMSTFDAKTPKVAKYSVVAGSDSNNDRGRSLRVSGDDGTGE